MKKLLLHIFLILLSAPISAQFNFSHYGKEKGLNQSSTNALLFDSDGYLWLANFGGINRFDGFTFESYENEFGDTNSISDNSVWTFYEDQQQTIWVGTKSSLSQYHPRDNNFSNYYIVPKGNNATLAIKAIHEDRNGNLYIGTEGKGLYLFNRSNHQFSPISIVPNDLVILDLTEDDSGQLWIASENKGVFIFSADRKKVTALTSENLVAANNIYSLLATPQGVWVGTGKNGAFLVSPQVPFQTLVHLNPTVVGAKVNTIAKDGKGNIWVGSATDGVCIYNPSNSQKVLLKAGSSSFEIADNNVSSICFGQNGVGYIGYYMKGFDAFISTPFQIITNQPGNPTSLSHDNVYCMYQDKAGELWFGTFGGGLNHYLADRNEFIHYQHNPQDRSTLSHDWIRIIFEDSKNRFWVGTWGGGLNLLDRKTGKAKRYSHQPEQANSISHDIITAAFEDSDGQLWFGTYGGGLNIYNEATDDFRHIKNDPQDLNSLSDDHITSFWEDDQGQIWICTYGGGLCIYNKPKRTFERFLPDENNPRSINTTKLLHIYPEKGEDYVWISTIGGGLNKFYPNTKEFYHYTTHDGIANNTIMGLLKDSQGRYWMSSNNGISLFYPSRDSFVNYKSIDGTGNDDFNLEAYAADTAGNFYFGGKNGVTVFQPNSVHPQGSFPRLAVKHVKIDGIQAPYSFLEKANWEFPYKKRVNIGFVALNPAKPKKINYAYQLNGVSNSWIELGTQNNIEFTNLDPKSYELLIRSTNSDGIWSKDYLRLSFVVPPPWYMTWTFRISSVLFIALIVFAYYRRRLNLLEEQKRILEVKVKDRTKTIAKQKEKLEDSYHKLQRLEKAKDAVAGMIAHDLKNPINSIIHTVNNNIEDSPEKTQIILAGKKMINLVQNMMDVQKMEDEKLSIHSTSCSLHKICQHAIEQVQLLASEKRIQIINNTPSDKQLYIDIDLIERVFVNLLTNAIKFSNFDSNIEINFCSDLSTSKWAWVEVKDYGKGIPKDSLGDLFRRFSQIEKRKSGRIKSTGLGLAFCQMAVKAHGGEISVDSEVANFTSFKIGLPRIEDLASVDNTTETSLADNNFKNYFEFNFTDEDYAIFDTLSDKIQHTPIFAAGNWLQILEDIDKESSPALQKWSKKMFTAVTSFDNNAYLKLIALTKKAV